MHRGKFFKFYFSKSYSGSLIFFSFIFLSPTVVAFFNFFFSKSYSGSPTLGLRKNKVENFPLCISYALTLHVRTGICNLLGYAILGLGLEFKNVYVSIKN